MRIEIDQSGKIADTKVPTVLAFSDGISYSILVTATTKRKLVRELRRTRDSKVFYFQLFAFLIFILLEDFIPRLSSIFIDQEYEGREDEIKAYFIHVCQRKAIKIDPQAIHFTHIGKYSKAHIKAIESLRDKKADKEVSFEEAMSYFSPIKKDRGSYRLG